MLTFELSKTTPKLIHNRFSVLQTPKHYYILIYIVLFINSAFLYAQDLPTKSEVNIPAATEVTGDTTEVRLRPVISERSEVVADTIKNDSIKEKPEFLTDIVDYYGEDYIFNDYYTLL